MSSNNQTVAFFGATGGCAATVLAAALRDGLRCTALARTPDKLRNLLQNDHSIPTSTIDSRLTIHAGNVKSVEDVKRALVSPMDGFQLVDKIMYGIGATPKLQLSLTTPVGLDDAHVCENGMSTVITALDSLINSDGIKTSQAGIKPVIICISTTGVSNGERDVPLALYPLYHWTLKVPHIDKRNMEQLAVSAAGKQVSDFVIVRPTLLTDGQPKGVGKVRAGWEWGDRTRALGTREPGPQMGYTISRKDVGEWIFQQVVKGKGWEGKCVSLAI